MYTEEQANKDGFVKSIYADGSFNYTNGSEIRTQYYDSIGGRLCDLCEDERITLRGLYFSRDSRVTDKTDNREKTVCGECLDKYPDRLQRMDLNIF